MNSPDVQTLLQQGRLDEAEQAARHALQRQPGDIESLNALGLIALRRGQLERAHQLLESSIASDPNYAQTRHYLGRVYDAAGNLDGAVAAHGAALKLAPGMFIIRLHYAAALERAGQKEQAAVQYFRASGDAQAQGRWTSPETTAPALRPMVEHAVRMVKETRKATFAHLIEPLRQQFGAASMQRVEQSLRIYFREEPPVYPDPRQQPTFLYLPGLPPAPYLPRSLFPWIEALEAQTDAIRQELLQLLPSAAGRERVFTTEAIEQQNLRGLQSPPSWNGYYFYRHAQRRADNCAVCPATAKALDLLPLSHVRDHGPEVLFSVFTAGTHLLPHRGVTNTRLVGHLPLLVPPDCALKVGDEVHEWQEGRAVIFDDTYEHEAWNRSDRTRVVLIFDIWNPYLTEAERAAIELLVPAMGDFRKAAETA
ncbi:aspartyl/asparaginyl beta-hydroxylase domain-containing protein [Steroidobacter sp.]|uniref:aspartyl/asparaginyl beta-hydroxylase domain-containing protein n=1 Tax=Steroidobacter sp. TaxID=1978227 RepID=UPI001A506DA0|nr:aspartyl/asparaginyl beta-hydroxylase domain-containing protein [Steroidobacter sp.]MBL8269680.1 aspartyl/asparaginyl beta-hydroxylase domain-containing protein [Steroidobacter sp.]